ncbi:MAG: mannose-1-phosphate guanylyltransferase [Desulfotomaculaceae bacterium]|nr:mannose-1-phosphate guanylyltransferase [Desulfotomaculaceae bacterium]
MPCVVIMAGGRGERFWPRSRMAMPKQFLNLIGDKTMLQLTVERVKGLVDLTDIYIVAGREFREIIINQIPDLPESNFVIEPFGRDTAAAIGLAALVVRQKNPLDVEIVLPADNYVNDEQRFQEILRAAVIIAGKGEQIITLGITPHRPETGYGYICQGDLFDTVAGTPVYQVDRFLEKPNYKKALEFLSRGDYLWNSGMFICRVDLIGKLVALHAPLLAEGLNRIEGYFGTGSYPAMLEEVYNGLPKISVDYGIMEREENVLVIRGDFGWDDIGSWTALERYRDQDESGNVIEAKGVFLDTNDSYVYSPDKIVALIGVEDLIVVNDSDCLLVCHKDKTQEIKKAVQILREQGYEEVL